MGFSDFLYDSISHAQNRGVICAAQIDSMIAFLGPKLERSRSRLKTAAAEPIMEARELGSHKDIHLYT